MICEYFHEFQNIDEAQFSEILVSTSWLMYKYLQEEDAAAVRMERENGDTTGSALH